MGEPGTKLAQHAIKHRFSAIFRALGEFFHAQAGNRPSRAKKVTHQHSPSLRWASFLPPSPLPHHATHSGRQSCLKETRTERKTTPAQGSSTTDKTFFAPAWGSGTPDETFFAHAYPKWLIFDHFHRAGAIFLSQRHPNYRPVLRRGDISFMHPRRGRHRRNRAHLKTQRLAAEPEGHGRTRPQKSRMQFDWKKFQQRLKTLQFQQSKFMV